jgi:hypothetical protein
MSWTTYYRNIRKSRDIRTTETVVMPQNRGQEGVEAVEIEGASHVTLGIVLTLWLTLTGKVVLLLVKTSPVVCTMHNAQCLTTMNSTINSAVNSTSWQFGPNWAFAPLAMSPCQGPLPELGKARPVANIFHPTYGIGWWCTPSKCVQLADTFQVFNHENPPLRFCEQDRTCTYVFKGSVARTRGETFGALAVSVPLGAAEDLDVPVSHHSQPVLAAA